jgi:hypothetical protein
MWWGVYSSFSRGCNLSRVIGSSHQTLRFCEVGRTKALRGIEDAESRTKWISDYRAFPNSDVERGDEDLATFRRVMNYGENDTIDQSSP